MSEDRADSETVFPWALAEEVFALLREKQVQVTRYCDLDTRSSWFGSSGRYVDEYVRFRAGSTTPLAFAGSLSLYASIRWGRRFDLLQRWVKQRSRDFGPPTVLLQHDADLLPDKTYRMMEREIRLGLRSSAYVFVEHATEPSYRIDVRQLQELEAQGFEIGYHQNAFERADYDLTEAVALASKDVTWLEQHFNIRSFVPHGGEPSSDGRNNEHLPQRGKLKRLLWAYNGRCILKDYTWSDGGIRKRYPDDPREFVLQLLPGSRAMMLMHPQYYGDVLRDDWETLPIAGQSWWRKLWDLDSRTAAVGQDAGAIQNS